MIKQVSYHGGDYGLANMNEYIKNKNIEKSQIISISVDSGYYHLFYWDFEE